jgi:ATP-binding cassette subfamily C (CFTR/MRP) protein 4
MTSPGDRFWQGDWESFVAQKRKDQGKEYNIHDNSIFPDQENILVRSWWRIVWICRGLLFMQVDPLIRYGYKNQLEAKDFPPVQHYDSAEYLSGSLTDEWYKQQATGNPSLWRAIVKVFGPRYSVSIVLAIFDLIGGLLQAYVFHLTIGWFSDSNASLSSGFLYAAMLLLVVIIESLNRHQCFYISMRLGFDLRNALVGTIYSKSLRLSLGDTSSTGKIVNLCTNDVQRFEDAAPFAYFLFLAPIEAVIVGIYLYFYIGVAAWAGMAALLVVIPIQAIFSRLFGSVRRRVVAIRDERIRNTSDALFGVNVVKVYAWEEAFADKLGLLRTKEVDEIRNGNYMKAANDGIFFSTPAVIGLVTWITFWALGNEMNADDVFMASILFQWVRLAMCNSFPKAVQYVSESKVSLKRIQEFLSIPEMQLDRNITEGKHQLAALSTNEPVSLNGKANLHPKDALSSHARTPSSDKDILIHVESSTFAWDIQGARGAVQTPKPAPTGNGYSTWMPWRTNKTLDPYKTVVDDRGIPLSLRDVDESGLRVLLKHITLDVRRGELLCIVGPVGSGKSSLLLGILGEMIRTEGSVLWGTDKVAYCPQAPWIVAGSVQDNITFGKDYNDDRFHETIEACSMTRDLTIFPEHQHSLVGERGITMSGGQKARVSLGRAVYHDADVYILDDVLSAVDTAVGRHLFEKCIIGTLRDERNAGVVLVTHQLQFVKRADRIIVLDSDGTISAQGSWTDIVNIAQEKKQVYQQLQAEAFAALPSDTSIAVPVSTDDAPPSTNDTLPMIKPEQRSSRPASSHVGNFLDVLVEFDKTADVGMDMSVDDTPTEAPRPTPSPLLVEERKKEFTQEARAQGSVTWKVYWTYFSAGGGFGILLILALLMIGGQVLMVMSDWWLSQWTNMTFPSPQSNGENAMIYGILCISLFIASIIRAEAFYYVCIRASITLSEKMLGSVLASPMSFFQVNPHGRLLNRFSSDLSRMDELLPATLFDFLQCTFMIVGIIVLACILVPWILLVVPFIVAIFYILRKVYVTTSRQIKRWESITRSPLLSQVPASLEGLAVIRAFGVQDEFVKNFLALQNVNNSQYYGFVCTSRWLGIRLDLLAGSFLGISALVCVALGQTLSPGVVGLLLSYLNGMVGLSQWAVRQSSEVENLMVATERVLEYTVLPSEPPRYTDVHPPKGWPEDGRIEFKQMSMTYPVTDTQVLKNLTFEVPPGAKVGIVGRTGAGKSSTLSALFRLVEPDPKNSIVIDSVPTSDLGLFDLRSRLNIIPQDSVLFQGSIRFNLDPFNNYSDLEIWQALDVAQLKVKIEGMPDRLESAVTDQGGNWSVGERQLLCLARAVLRKSKIMVLDEASANVDLRTDRLIQTSIRDETGPFAQATVLTIAHRLQTVIDYDLILVLDAGQVVEYGRPYDLLKKGGWFGNMVHEMGVEAEGMLKEIAYIKEQERREALGLDRFISLKSEGEPHLRRASTQALELLASFPSPSQGTLSSLDSSEVDPSLLSIPRRASRASINHEMESRRLSRVEATGMGVEYYANSAQE